MFNREIKVSMEKKNKSGAAQPNLKEVDLEGKTAIISHAVESSIKKIGLAVCAYVVLDTIRQVVVKATVVQ